MATRFYFSSSTAPIVSPSFAGWNRTTEGVRRTMSPTKDANGQVGAQMWDNSGTYAADLTALACQFVSEPMLEGVAFTTSDTVKGQSAYTKTNAGVSINRQPIALKVCSSDGSTLRATLKALSHYGPSTTEWVHFTYTNRSFATGATLDSNYTTVSGDRLVLEVGGQIGATGVITPLGFMTIGSASATDLGENETQTDVSFVLNPWFEISTNISFSSITYLPKFSINALGF